MNNIHWNIYYINYSCLCILQFNLQVKLKGESCSYGLNTVYNAFFYPQCVLQRGISSELWHWARNGRGALLQLKRRGEERGPSTILIYQLDRVCAVSKGLAYFHVGTALPKSWSRSAIWNRHNAHIHIQHNCKVWERRERAKDVERERFDEMPWKSVITHLCNIAYTTFDQEKPKTNILWHDDNVIRPMVGLFS